MRWINKRKVSLRTNITRTYFAWLPVKIGIETRWLDYVTVYGYYWEGMLSGNIYWEPIKFID